MSESSPSWKGLPLYQKLGDNHTGPLGPQLRKGLHNKPAEQTSPTCPSQGAELLKRGNSEPLQGGSEHGRKECNIQSLQRTITTFHGSKERWGPKAHHQPEKAQLLCTNRALQNGGHSYSQRPPKARGLDDQSRRPEGRLLHDTGSNKPQELGPVQVARGNLPVQLSPFRVVVGSVGLYQDYQADCSHPQDNGPEDDHLHI